ncbi:MAG: type II secretion system protein [Alphaproteobacteria bacterium]|nr:type II secretion system protein [Alphaproteobacteria bacterium]
MHKCWGRRISAFCKFFKHPSPAGKSAISPSRGEGYRLHRPWCDKILGTRPRITGGRGANSFGRSMIEMLGVLAIIGVLSVGGIAGYSKAMEKFKINKVIDDFNMLAMNILEHRDAFEKLGNTETEYQLTDTIYAMNLVPSNWKQLSSLYLEDSMGNWLNIYVRKNSSDSYSGIVFDYNLDGMSADENNNYISKSFNSKLCFEFFNNIIVPMHNVFKRGRIYPNDSYIYYGDAYCDGKTIPCLKDLTLLHIKEICNSCSKTERCNITVNF